MGFSSSRCAISGLKSHFFLIDFRGFCILFPTNCEFFEVDQTHFQNGRFDVPCSGHSCESIERATHFVFHEYISIVPFLTMEPFVSTTLMLFSSSLLYLMATRFLIIENSRKRSENGDERRGRLKTIVCVCVCKFRSRFD